MKHSYRAEKSENITAFTMAEVLIALAVIGVVAAITLPRFINNINEKHYDTGRAVALSMIGEAGKRIAYSGEMNTSYNAQEFIDNILKKYLNITKSCIPGKFTDCGWNNEVKSLQGNSLIFKHDTFLGSFSDINTQARTHAASCSSNSLNGTCNNQNYFRAFTTTNGYAFILYYNPYCAPEKLTGDFQTPTNKICMQVLYDMNGLKGPNKYGKDIGHITVFNGDETTYTVAPYVDNVTSSGTPDEAVSFCASRGKGYYLPSIDELLSISFSSKFNDYTDNWFISSTKIPENIYSLYYTLYTYTSTSYRGGSSGIVCVKH